MSRFKTKPLLTLFALMLCFAIPLLLATWLYSHPSILTNKTTNRGLLVSPPLSMTQLQSQPISNNHKWLLAVVSPHDCSATCRRALHFAHQIQLASGKNRHRISRMLLTDADAGLTQDSFSPDILKSTFSQQQLKQLIGQRHQLAFMEKQGGILIADPHSNVVLAYPLDGDYMDIFKDLRHLLKVSEIG